MKAKEYSSCFLPESCSRYAGISCILIEQEPILVFAQSFGFGSVQPLASSLKLSTSERLKMTTKATLSNWILWRSLNNSIFGANPHLAQRVAFFTIVLPISHISPPGQGGRRRDAQRSISIGVCRLDVTASQTRTCSRRCSCPALVA